MTQSTAEIYRQKESSSLTQTAKYIFSKLFSSCEVFELGDLLNDIKTGKTPSKNEKKYYEDEFIDWFKPNEIGDKKYLEKAESKLSKFAYERGQVTVYKANSILINAIGDIGRIAILNHEASSNQQITGIELNEEKLLTEYCYYYLLANRYHFYKDLFQTTLPIVNQKKIKLIPIPVPELHEQKRIVEFLNKLENVKSIEELKDIKGFEDFIEIAEKFYILKEKSSEISTELTHQLVLVKQLRQAFLREAMQGQLVPQDPKDEPASVLLEKIKAEKERLIKEKKIKKQKPLPPINKDEIPFEIEEGEKFVRLGDFFAIEKGKIGIKKAIPGNVPLVVTGEERLTHNEIHFSGAAVIVPLVSSTGHGHASLKRIHYQEGNFAVGNILGCIMPLLPDYFNMKFLFQYLDYYKEFFFVDKMKGAANVSLKISSISETPIPLIDKKIQDKYEELIKVCDKLEASIKESQQQNELLLQQVLREALEPKEKEVEKV